MNNSITRWRKTYRSGSVRIQESTAEAAGDRIFGKGMKIGVHVGWAFDPLNHNSLVGF